MINEGPQPDLKYQQANDAINSILTSQYQAPPSVTAEEAHSQVARIPERSVTQDLLVAVTHLKALHLAYDEPFPAVLEEFLQSITHVERHVGGIVRD